MTRVAAGLIGNPDRALALVREFRREHALICEVLETRCRTALGLPLDVELGDVATALLYRELAQAIAEYQRDRLLAGRRR